ncbi:MAG: nucleoside kinase [Bacteroidales bacterium]|nr:nucleoside kinase [Bacteroidales bacterium]
MDKLIEIIFLNNKSKKKYKIGTSLQEMAVDQKIKLQFPILGALVNNKVRELSYLIIKPKIIKFIDITHPEGMRMYFRSISFVLFKAITDLYPEAKLRIEHAVSKGFFCEIENLQSGITDGVILSIKNRMEEIIKKNITFKRKEILTKDAIKLFKDKGFDGKSDLFITRYRLYTSVYSLGDNINYFYGYLVPSTGYLKVFDLVKYYQSGLLLKIPSKSNPNEVDDTVKQKKLFNIFREHKLWAKILSVSNVGKLNELVVNNNASELIKISEALHEKKVAKIADMIFKKRKTIRLVLIAGPSSSGKTTFCKRLAIQLKVAKLKPIVISIDNYFINRDETPKDENGKYNFETIDAIDLGLLNENLLDLLNGKEVILPKFDFLDGNRFYSDNKLKITEENIILVEGIHALNPQLTFLIDESLKFKVFASALTQISIDEHNYIPTADNRLIRRIIRDYHYRNYSALQTLQRWESVRDGEDKNIFPYQETADVMFNSALLYELGVLKKYAEPIIKIIQENQPEYFEAVRLLKFLSYFLPIPDDEIPPTSILREFLGGSTFDY